MTRHLAGGVDPPSATMSTDVTTSRDLNAQGELYLALLKQCLTRSLFIDEELREVAVAGRGSRLLAPLVRLLNRRGLRIVRVGGDPALRQVGRDWPPHAETMVGSCRLDNVQACVTDVIRDGVPGDFIETGVWRGGTTIFMRAVLAAFGDVSRTVWVADSFKGLPSPDPDLRPPDNPGAFAEPVLAVSLDQVKANFSKYGLLDDQVRFLPGWFCDTLPDAPIERLAVIRLDGDLYESTMDAISALYPKLSVGGYVIVDDYRSIDVCRQAITDYRSAHGITETIEPIDWTAVCWRRLS